MSTLGLQQNLQGWNHSFMTGLVTNKWLFKATIILLSVIQIKNHEHIFDTLKIFVPSVF